MDTPKEIELKLTLPPGSLQRVERSRLVRARHGEAAHADEVTSVYFDTPKFKLRKKGILLRVRRIGQRRLQTVKASGPSASIERPEWETEIGGDEPDLSAARGTALEPLLTRKVRAALAPVFATQVRRKTIPVRRRNSTVELGIDEGRIKSNGRSLPIAEIELELKEGETAELFALARGLAKDLPVHPSLISKGERGYVLARDRMATPVKAASVHLHAEAPVADAFRAVGYGCLRQLIANEPAVHAADPEGVHQARVALRRLRAAMSIFSAVIAGARTRRIKSELKWLAGELAPARDLDAFVSGSIAPMRNEAPAKRGLRTLDGDLERRRKAVFDRARAALGSARYRRLLLDTIEWLELGAWTQAHARQAAALRKQSIGGFAERELARRRRKVVKKGKKLHALDARQRHKLRIAAKKLRYASEFFASLFAGRKRRKRLRAFEDAVEGLQDCLGALNDIRTHEGLIADLVERPHANGQRARRRAYAAGVVSGREDAQAVHLLRSARKAAGVLARAKPFWT